MSKVDVLGADGTKAGSAELPDELFDVQTNIPLIHQVVVAQQAAARQGTHATKTRGLVSGGGKKPYRQKGTGRARQGSTRAPQFTGGGTVHGPQPHGYAQRTPKKMIAAALRGSLSDRARDGKVFVLESIVAGETPSTKSAIKALEAVGDIAKLLVVIDRDEDVAWLSLRNVPQVHALVVDQLNAYDVLVNDAVVFTQTALETFSAGPRKGRAAKAVATESELTESDIAPASSADVQRSTVAQAATAASTSAATDDDAEPRKDYGKDSYRGEKPPAGFDIKGNEDSMKYHTPESPYYDATDAEVWFNSIAAAKAAGFEPTKAEADKEDEK